MHVIEELRICRPSAKSREEQRRMNGSSIGKLTKQFKKAIQGDGQLQSMSCQEKDFFKVAATSCDKTTGVGRDAFNPRVALDWISAAKRAKKKQTSCMW